MVTGSGGEGCQTKLGGEKVNRKLSELREFILQRAAGGVKRAEIIEGYYGLERRYVDYYSDPCLSRGKELEYQRRYRSAQVAVTRAVHWLENHGLVRPIRHGRYVKWVEVTEEGRRVAAGVADAGQAHRLVGSSSAASMKASVDRVPGVAAGERGYRGRSVKGNGIAAGSMAVQQSTGCGT